MKKSTIVEIISALFILLFVYTAVSKLIKATRFENTISKSPLIKDFAETISIGLPVLEIVIAVLLVLPATRLIGLWSATVAMFVFTIYIGYMLAFTTDLPCSCGGVLEQMTWRQHLVFNIALIVVGMLGIAFYRKEDRNIEKLYTLQVNQ